MKKVFLLIFVFCCLSANAVAQQCGGSIRTIRFDFEKNTKKPEKIYYRLFFLMPKRADRYIGNKQTWESLNEEQAVFLSNFLFDNPKPPDKLFWVTLDADAKLIEVPKIKAETYAFGFVSEKAGFDLKNAYKLKNFEGLWTDLNLPQLWGNTCDGTLELTTHENDYTSFLMQVSAEGFEPLYFVTNFLGGCFLENVKGEKQVQHIQMRTLKK